MGELVEVSYVTFTMKCSPESGSAVAEVSSADHLAWHVAFARFIFIMLKFGVVVSTCNTCCIIVLNILCVNLHIYS